MTLSVRGRQFRVLYRVFLLRVIDIDALSAEGDPAKLLGQIAAVFAGISFLFTSPLIFLGAKLPETAIWTTEHLLIATTMTAAGLFAVLSWDSLVPDRRDVFVLAPLPIRASTIFFTKLAAVGASLGLMIASLNVFSGLIWPFLFTPPEGRLASDLRTLAAYWMTIVLAAGFTFGLILGVQGICARLPRQMYLRSSALIQTAGFCLFVGVYFLEPSLETRQALTSPANQGLLACLPSYWFLGLFQQLNGSLSPGFLSLAHRAWTGSAVVACVAFGVLLVSYFRAMRKLVEEPDILPSARRFRWSFYGDDAMQSAIRSFSMHTLLRSRQHRLIASFYLGVGSAAALAYMQVALGGDILHGMKSVQMPVVVMTTTILLMSVSVAAIRIVVSMPISLGANWIFRMTELQDVPKYMVRVSHTLFLIGVVPMWLLIAGVLFWAWPFGLAAAHLLALGLFGGCLVELSLLGFQKVPFTCSYLPGKANVHIVFWVSVMLLIPLADRMARFEIYMDRSTVTGVLLIALLAAIWAVARWRTRARANTAARLSFEDMPSPDVFALKLDRR